MALSSSKEPATNAEQSRLEDARAQKAPWKLWGPYLSERQWGTVREDYSEGGDAWNYFTHDQARSRAYRWGEDGLAGISDDQQRLCFALALWNGKDPILKERLFGLTNAEGNHGEDVKEYYFYLDTTPTHSYMKYLYKYPQAAFPYDDLVETNRRRSRQRARVRTDRHGRVRRGSLLRRVRRVRQGVARRHPDSHHASTTVARMRPSCISCRRCGSATSGPGRPIATRPTLAQVADGPGGSARASRRTRSWATRYLYCEGDVPLLFTENETNTQRIFGVPNQSPYVKDGINDSIVHGRGRRGEPGEDRDQRRSPLPPGHRSRASPPSCACGCRTSAAALAAPRTRRMCSSATHSIRWSTAAGRRPMSSTPRSFRPRSVPTAANVMRQALAGMLWRKQFYRYDVDQWLKEHGSDPFNPVHKAAPRNDRWHHMYNARRDFHAGQVGVPVVRRLGPRLPCAGADPRGPRLRQAATESAAARALHAPQRSDARLRVELRRRQSSGACLGHDLRLPPRQGADRGGRHGVVQELFSQAAAELHLVGQSQGPHRAQCLRGRLPRSRQHRRRSTAARRCRPADTWSRPTAPRGWRCSARTCWRLPRSWR